jgi:hypothetical protein
VLVPLEVKEALGDEDPEAFAVVAVEEVATGAALVVAGAA